MSLSPPLSLSPDDKLDVLRHLDEFRFWHSLDDERRCTRCHEIMTGRQILVLERTGTRGRMRLQCATPSCASAPSDWVYLNPFLFATFKTPSARPRPSHHDEVSSAAAKYRQTENAEAPGGRPRYLALFGALLVRFRMRRPLAADLHPIHPVG